MRDIEIGDWTKLGSIIRAERKRAGLTQSELANRADTARSWIARIEAGHRGAEFEPILRLLRALDLQLILRSQATTDEPGHRIDSPSSPPIEGDSSLEAETWETIRAALGDKFTEQASSRRDAWQHGSIRHRTDFTFDHDIELASDLPSEAQQDQGKTR